MNIYVETNFVLELVFQQPQSGSCEQILQLCGSQSDRLILPAYCLAEPHEKLARQRSGREALQTRLDEELDQLARSAPYAMRIRTMREIRGVLVQSTEEERGRFVDYRNRLLKAAELIPLTTEIHADAASCEVRFPLKPQDAIVLASILWHLRRSKPDMACFLNLNFKDFGDPDILDELVKLNCQLIPSFDHGFAYIQKWHERRSQSGKSP